MDRRTLLMTLCATTLAASVLTLGACGGGSDAKAKATATQPATAASASAAATNTATNTAAGGTPAASATGASSATATVGTSATAGSTATTAAAATPTPGSGTQPTPVPPTAVPPTAVPTASGPLTASVGVSETSVFLFTPSNVTIAVGGTVSFAWSNTSQFHDVTFDDGPASGDPAKTGSYSRTLTSPGTYPFECTVHASSRPPMKGTVTVK